MTYRDNSRTRHATACAVLVLGGACSSLTDADHIQIVRLDPPVDLVQPILVTSSRSTPIEIEYWTDAGPVLRVRSESAREHALHLTRLVADRTYHYRITGSARSGTFRTQALPEDLQRLAFETTGVGSAPLVLLHLFEPGAYRGYAVVDGMGNVVWHLRTVDFPYGATRRANGNFVFMDKGRGLIEVTPAGAVVATLAQSDDREMHHDVIATPDNTLLFIAFDDRVIAGARVRGEAIWEWSPETAWELKRWTSWDYLDVVADRGPRFTTEWLHANALALGSRRNVLISMHYLNQILSLSPDMTAIEWRLGGVNATITLPAGTSFSGQHTPREVAMGRLLLFDNALERSGPSRALEVQLQGERAETTWEWTSPGANFAAAVSSARRLPNGNTLVAFGMSAGLNSSSGPTEVFEVATGGAVVWRLGVTGTWVMFRAEPLDAIGTEIVIER